MKYKKMRKFNRNQKQNRRNKTAQAVRDTLEGLKIPSYIDRDWCDQLHFTSVYPEEERTYGITNHAQVRMSQRGISKDAMAVVLKYGRRVHAQNVIVYFFGRKEMKRYLKPGQNASRWTGFRDIHVLVSPSDDTIITTYKNQDITIKADF
jgi:hypothetical protein